MNQESDNSKRGVTCEGSIRPWFISRAVPLSAAVQKSEVAATVRECAEDVVGVDLGCVDENPLRGVGDKRQRRTAEEMLDTGDDVPALDLSDFVSRMSSMNVDRG